MDKMKLLVISHNPFSTYQSMGKTFLSLFASFRKEELCQLYVYPSYPNVDAVASCYRLTDRDAIKTIFPFCKAGGEVTAHTYTGSMIESKTDKRIYTQKSKHSPMKRLARDAVWKLAHWYSREIREWLDREAPTCIFLAPGYAQFIYDIALKIAQDRKIPIVTYICDDYYFIERPKTLMGRIQLKLLQRKTRQTMEKTELMVAISSEIGQQYASAFSVETELIMTGSNFPVAESVPERASVSSFSYFGNIGVNRETSLAAIGRALDEINEVRNTDYRLKIYTKSESTAIDVAFSGIRSIQKCDFLVGDAFVQELTNADCLVHVEAFDQESIGLVKGSISTKIADSLASGIPLLAYGPAGIASVEHLRRNSCAFIADRQEDLKVVLREVIDDGEKRRRIAEAALKVARMYHVSETNSKRLKKMIECVQERT